MSGLREVAQRWFVVVLAVIGGLWVVQKALLSVIGPYFGDVLEAVRSPDGKLDALATEEQGFGAITPNIVRVVLTGHGIGPGMGREVLHGSNLKNVRLSWSSSRRLQITMPCSRHKSQNYFYSNDYSRNVEIVLSTPDPSCWNGDA